jgi:putative transcriptional regulator
MDKQALVKRNVHLLDKLGFNQVSVADIHSCFDILAEKNGFVVMLKVVKNIDSLNESSVSALKKLGRFLDADTFVIGYMHKGERLADDSSLDRRGVSCISENALEYMLISGDRIAQSEKFCGAKYKIDGAALKRMRMLCGISMRGLAEVVGISKDSIYRYEKGEAYATRDYVDRLERFFKNRLAYGEQSTTALQARQKYKYKKLNENLDMQFLELGCAPFELLGKHENRYEVGERLDPRTIGKLSILYKGMAELLKRDYPFFITDKTRRTSINGVAVLRKKELKSIYEEDELINLISSKI